MTPIRLRDLSLAEAVQLAAAIEDRILRLRKYHEPEALAAAEGARGAVEAAIYRGGPARTGLPVAVVAGHPMTIDEAWAAVEVEGRRVERVLAASEGFAGDTDMRDDPEAVASRNARR